MIVQDQGNKDMSAPTVTIGIQELINLMSGEIARKVTDELKAQHIDPLVAEVAELKLQLATPNKKTEDAAHTLAYWKGAIDACWKLGVAAIAILELYHLFHPAPH